MSELIAEPGAPEAAAEPAAAPAEAVDPLEGGAGAGEAASAVETPEAPAAPAFDPAEYDARLEYLSQRNEQLLAALEEYAGGAQTQQPQAQPGMPDLSAYTDEFGNVTPEGLIELLAAQERSILGAFDERFTKFSEPFAQQREAEAYSSGLESARDMLGDNVAQHGEFAAEPEADKIARDRVLDRADTLLTTPDFQRRYGSNLRAAEIAIAQAAQEERQYLASVRGEGATEQANRLATLAGAVGEPGGVGAAGVAGRPAFASRSEMLAHYASEARRIGPPDTNDPRYAA